MATVAVQAVATPAACCLVTPSNSLPNPRSWALLTPFPRCEVCRELVPDEYELEKQYGQKVRRCMCVHRGSGLGWQTGGSCQRRGVSQWP